jgi:hypothetical protein
MMKPQGVKKRQLGKVSPVAVENESFCKEPIRQLLEVAP